MNNQLDDDSDSSDEDYIPGNKPEDAVSEADSDGVSEDALSDAEDLGKRNQKRRKNLKSKKSEKATDVSQDDCDETEEDKKKKADDLWADFMKDTGFTSKTNATSSNQRVEKKAESQRQEPKIQSKSVAETVKITEVFEFAGEEVKVEKEVPSDSIQARLLSEPSKSTGKTAAKRSGLSGIGSVLSQLGKKRKISTLEKSKLDWEKFKKDENLDEEIKSHNKGKDGYLDKQDFLQRADLRQFEIEKEIRTIERNKRLNENVNAPF